jgi:TetR/AcrR family transcriptional repressor of nem operon
MPYPANHRAEKKRAIIDSARKLFNRSGFDNVALQEIMAGAGLTHGGFYTYFKSKSDLCAEVLGCFFTDPNWKSCWEGVKVDLSSTDVGSQVVRAYLSRQHFEDIENSHPMVACLQMLRVAVQPPKAPSKQYLGPWSAFWSTA